MLGRDLEAIIKQARWVKVQAMKMRIPLPRNFDLLLLEPEDRATLPAVGLDADRCVVESLGFTRNAVREFNKELRTRRRANGVAGHRRSNKATDVD